MSKFKVGDTVILEKYQRVSGRPSSEGNELEDWDKQAKLPLNTPLGVSGLSPRGWLYFGGYKFCHHPYKFKLKTDTMSKQLTGYKLTKSIPGDSRTVGTVVPMTTEDNGYYSFLPDFWEPQYKEGEQFKKGDMVYVIPGLNPDTYIVPKESKMGFGDYKSHAGKVYPVGDNKYYPGLVLLVDRNGNSIYYLPEQCARLATAEEIKNKEAVIVNGYESVYSPGMVAFGCKSFFKAEVQALLKFLSTSDVRVKFEMGGTPVTVDMLNTILKNI